MLKHDWNKIIVWKHLGGGVSLLVWKVCYYVPKLIGKLLKGKVTPPESPNTDQSLIFYDPN